MGNLYSGVAIHTTAGCNPHSGYGKVEIGLLRGFAEIGIPVTPSGPVDWAAVAVLSNVACNLEFNTKQPVTIVTAHPRKCPKGAWLYTMSESDRVSEKWVKAINKKCAGVLVPCPQLVEIYQQSGVKVPVYDVGCGVDYFVPKYNLNKAPKKINFLTYSYGDMRKGAHLAIVAFKRLFGNKPKYQLWVKSRVSKGSWLAGCKDEQIKLWSGEYTESRWFDLLQNVQGFVFPSYGEGFGLPPREAALAGTPAIATQWLGLWDVQEWGYPVRVKRMLPAQFDFWEANEQGALWAEADVDHLAEQMEWVAENPALAKEKARAGRDYLLDNFTWAKTARRIIEVISLERKDNGDHSATNH